MSRSPRRRQGFGTNIFPFSNTYDLDIIVINCGDLIGDSVHNSLWQWISIVVNVDIMKDPIFSMDSSVIIVAVPHVQTQPHGLKKAQQFLGGPLARFQPRPSNEMVGISLVILGVVMD